MIGIFILVVIYAGGLACTCAAIAGSRNHDTANWFMLGMLFGVFALIVLCAMPARPPRMQWTMEQELDAMEWATRHSLPLPVPTAEQTQLDQIERERAALAWANRHLTVAP